MKKNYCYLRRTTGISANDVVYKVPIGTSVREMRKKALIETYAEDVGTYFKIWDDDCDKALEFAEKIVFGKVHRFFGGFRIQVVSIDRLYRMIIDDSFDEFEKSITPSQNQIHLLQSLSILPPDSFNSEVSRQDCQSVSRKNLSHDKRREALSAAILSGLVLALFLIVGYLENVERCLW